MTIEHVVLLQTAEGRKPQEMTDLAQEWRGLVSGIEGVEHAALGPIVSPDAKGYTHMVIIRFANEAARDAFDAHPGHVAARALLKDVMGGFLIADLHLD